jgi:hypothetical protein
VRITPKSNSESLTAPAPINHWPKTGFGDIGRELPSAALHFSQANLWPGTVAAAEFHLQQSASFTRFIELRC